MDIENTSAVWCIYCRAEIPEEAEQCPKCGKPLTDHTRVVRYHTCGGYILKDDSQCRHCGALCFAAEPESPAPPAEPSSAPPPESRIVDDEDDEYFTEEDEDGGIGRLLLRLAPAVLIPLLVICSFMVGKASQKRTDAEALAQIEQAKQQSYDLGYYEGFSAGNYDLGYETGYAEGFREGNLAGYSSGYDDGQDYGYASGLESGQAQGQGKSG